MSDPVESYHVDGVYHQIYKFKDWTITTRRSHILESKCANSNGCGENVELDQKCTYCQYVEQINLPHFPDMTFAKNILSLRHKQGFGIEFDCFNALKNIPSKIMDNIKVDPSEDWKRARADFKPSQNVVNPYNWTFTTAYKGHLISSFADKSLIVEPTSEKINVDKLKVKDDILFFDDVHLFEDELADNGIARCTVKIRVMNDLFFILLRYFLRVDKVKVKLIDTRIYHEVNSDYLLREFTSREADLTKHFIPIDVLLDPVLLGNRLPVKEVMYEKLKFPS